MTSLNQVILRAHKILQLQNIAPRTCSRCLSHHHLNNVNGAITARTMSMRHASSQSNQPKSNLDYCIELVKKSDHENYLGILLLPKDLQRAAFALRAFNVELAQVRDSVTEKSIGLMRMQFWKECIERIYQSNPPEAPVVMELAGACQYFKLSKRWLKRAVEARAAHLEKDTFLSVQNVEDYAENVNSSLYYLLLECSGIKDLQASSVASHLGKAQGLVTLVRATPHHASGRKVYLPMEILAKHKVSQEDIIRGKNTQPVKDAIFELASLAHRHLEQARSQRSSIPDKSYLVFLNAAVCDYYLKALQKADFNVFDGKLQLRNNLLAYHMFVNKLKKRY